MKFVKCVGFLAGFLVSGNVLGGGAPKANVQLTMMTKVNPQALALWAITNATMDNKGEVVGSKVTAADWAKLLEIGKGLEEGGRALARKEGTVVATPGARLQDEGNDIASTAADVQHYVDAKPQVFRSHALELQKTGIAVIEAAKSHDAKRLSALSNSLDDVCEHCHEIFWYPEQSR